MGGFFAVASKEDCVFDLFFGTDYHSHLGTRRAGMAVYDTKKGFNRAIHNIENSPFRTKFESDFHEMEGKMGIGCISDYEPQPLIVRSHHGTFAISTVGKINNTEELVEDVFGADGQREVDACALQAVALVEAEDEVIKELIHGHGQRCLLGQFVERQRILRFQQRIQRHRILKFLCPPLRPR